MEWLAGARIALTPRPAEPRRSVLEAGMLGHCPGRVRLSRLLTLASALDEMRAIGFGAAVDELVLTVGLEQILEGHPVERLLLGKPAPERTVLLDSLRQATQTLQLMGLWSAPLDEGLLVRMADKLLLAKALDDILQTRLVDNLLQHKRVYRDALLDALEVLLRRPDVDAVLLTDGIDRLIKEKSDDGKTLAMRVNSLLDEALWTRSRALYHLPIPIHSSAEFHDIFPDASTVSTRYLSLLAGDKAWLGWAVGDFFANGGEKLWLVRIPEAYEQAGFFPRINSQPNDTATLQGLATLLPIPALGLIGFPDLERLQIPAGLPDIPRVRLVNPNPQFLPCSQNTDDDHRERRYSSELDDMPASWDLPAILRNMLQNLTRHRPDVQCLFTLPLAYSGRLESPVLDPKAPAVLESYRNDSARAEVLRHVQFLFPYLRGPRFTLHSPVGLIAGQQVAVARREGPWRSMAAKALVSDALPFPRLSPAQTVALREKPGIGVLNYRSSVAGAYLVLDDERLVVPALPAVDYPADRRRYDGFRSAEVMRFLGYLRRQLQAFGEQLVFNLDYRDPRPRLLLEQFFRRLHAQGALRGALPEQAFSITETNPQEGAMVFEIMVAPAFPIDRLFLTFTNLDGEWRSEVKNG